MLPSFNFNFLTLFFLKVIILLLVIKGVNDDLPDLPNTILSCGDSISNRGTSV